MTDLHILKLFIKPLADLHCGYGLQQGNVLPGHNYIPGRVLRGGLANWALRVGAVPDNTCDLFRKLFQTPDFKTAGVSFPYCHWRGHDPMPASVFRIGKSEAYDPKAKLISTSRHDAYAYNDEEIERGKARDFLLQTQWPCQYHPQLKPIQGMVTDLSKDPTIEGRSPLMLDMRNRHEPGTGRVGEDGLYAEEILSPIRRGGLEKTSYQGLMICTKEALGVFNKLENGDIRKINRAKQMDPAPEHVIFLGRRRVPAAVYAVEAQLPLMKGETQRIVGAGTEQNSISPITLSFISPYLPSKPGYPLTDDMLKEDLKRGNITIARRFCLPAWIHNFDVQMTGSGHTKAVAKRQGVPAQPCFAAGTCVSLKHPLASPAIEALVQCAFTGIGRETATGHGRFVLNASLHQLFRG